MEMPDPTEMGREVSHHLQEGHESRLRRDLGELERDWREIVVAFILALAALGSAWSAYQAASWGTRGSGRYAEATTKQAQSIQISTFGGQEATVDVAIYIDWFNAVNAGDTKLAEAVRTRMTPELSTAMDTWLGTTSGTPPKTLPPGGPFRAGGYVIPGSKEATALNAESTALQIQGETDHNRANRFVLIGVIFAVTLFFGAISGRFQAQNLRTAMVALAGIAFCGALAVLLLQPMVLP